MLHDFKKEFDGTTVEFKDKQLEISNGLLKRTWQLTDQGLRTSQLSTSGREWCRSDLSLNCDWELPGESKNHGEAKLLSIQAEESDDEKFTTQHVLITCQFLYEKDNLELQYLIWLYPEFAGMRTRYKIKRIQEVNAEERKRYQGKPKPNRTEFLPVNPQGFSRTYLGYYSDTQNRNDLFLDILKEETVDHKLISSEWNTWASTVCLEDESHGLAMVKESHKCVNKAGHDTGMFFICPEKGLMNSGWGMEEKEIPAANFAESWATWLFCWDQKTCRESAFKRFDRLRYPIHPERDVIIQANTWGSTNSGWDARLAAREESVLEEISCCADLGIDVIQIDDGWQVGEDNSTWKPDDDRGWRPHPLKYTDGEWNTVVKAAEEHGVKLGLWAPAIPISFEELVENHEKGGFVQFKLDFAHLESREEIDTLMEKVRKFIKATDHQVKVNWDLTEISPRYGYFFAREYGSIYLENRKPKGPVSAIYRPATVLRDLWQISKYVNLNKFQCSYQNIDMMDDSLSNARMYGHAYCFAATLMGTPLLFLETKYISDEARKILRPLIAAYKKVREEMFQGYVYPIGDKPNDASWSGFQNIAKSGNGYLTIFRELNNPELEKIIALRNLNPGTELKLTNLLTNETWEETLDENNCIKFLIPENPGFLFLKYGRVAEL